METPTASAPGEQPAASTAATNASEELRYSDAPSVLDDIPHDQLLAAMEELESGTPFDAQPDAAPAPVAQEAPVSEVVETEQDAPPPAQPEANKPPGRLSVRTLPAEQQRELADALDMVRRGEAPDIKTALGVSPMPVAATKAIPAEEIQQAPPAPAPAPASTAKVDEIKSQLDDLRAQRDQADDDFDRPKFRELTRQIEDLGLDLIRAENAAKEQTVQASIYDQQFAAAADLVETQYPDLQDDQSVMSRILDDRILAAKARGDSALQDPNFIRAFADQVAADLGITKGVPASTTQPAPARPSRPVGSGLAPGNQTTARPTPQQLQKAIHEMPIEELEALVCTE